MHTSYSNPVVEALNQAKHEAYLREIIEVAVEFDMYLSQWERVKASDCFDDVCGVTPFIDMNSKMSSYMAFKRGVKREH